MFKRWVLLVAVGLILAGCSSESSSGSVRTQLTADMENVRQSQQAALKFWDRIIFGETVSCQEAIGVPEPLSLPERDLQADPHAALVLDRLNVAVQDVRNSSDLWNIECADERPYVPLDMAREGRAEALAADEPLSDAAALLAN